MTWEETISYIRKQDNMRKLVLEAYYDDPLIEVAKRYYQSSEWLSIKKIIESKNGKILDVGAGRGISSYAFAKDGFNVYAIEPDMSQLVGVGAIERLSLENSLNIDVKCGLSESLPYDNSFFDIVFVRALLHHTTDLQKSCDEFYRVLKPGGMLIALREHVLTKQSDLNNFFDIHPLHKYYGGENAFILRKYKNSFINAGFKIDKILRPLENAVNYSPKNKIDIINEISSLIQKNFFLNTKLIEKALKTKFGWLLFINLVSLLDNRPGRLYSFVCTKR
jgi:2-polyprenyl-3-methyl-5-hydroxy-6-metoxy-1,4-benzoquinol methylase